MYYFFLWASRIVPRLPRWLLRSLPAIIGPLAYLVAGPVRRRAAINARHVLGCEIERTVAGRRRLRRVVRGMFRNSINNYLEAFLLSTISQQEVLHRVYAEHTEYIEEALALGKGVVLFSAHFGPFEYLAQWLVAQGHQVVIPVERLEDERMLKLMVDLRKNSGVNILPLGGSAPMRTIISALRKNQIVLIMVDRAIEGESVVRDFFGAPARLPIGPVNLAIRTGAPLVGALGWHSSPRRISGEYIRLTLALPEEQRKQPEIVEGAMLKELERVIGAHPEQWVVFAKTWED
jgi:KDO2-lipid IV(A) lauroyltransferase